MAGSRGFEDATVQRRTKARRDWNDEGEGRRREPRREPLQNTRPATFAAPKATQPVLAERITVKPITVKPPIKVKPTGPRMTAVVEKWIAERGYGFLLVPSTGEGIFANERELNFDPALMAEGLTVEFTVVADPKYAEKTRAQYITLAEQPLTVELVRHVMWVTERYGLLKNPDAAEGSRDNVFFNRVTAPNVTEQQDVRALVIRTAKGLKAVRIEPLR